jgi:hypothetical protein
VILCTLQNDHLALPLGNERFRYQKHHLYCYKEGIHPLYLLKKKILLDPLLFYLPEVPKKHFMMLIRSSTSTDMSSITCIQHQCSRVGALPCFIIQVSLSFIDLLDRVIVQCKASRECSAS